ncbi:hypothetical protein RJT34_03965 [Clitoria ternatea]|uniref:B box-type domain-containing protein n=1 Tax=Clitoria ternatea TaxID=43366 RepID=A0AAN9KLP6_CLITE
MCGKGRSKVARDGWMERLTSETTFHDVCELHGQSKKKYFCLQCHWAICRQCCYHQCHDHEVLKVARHQRDPDMVVRVAALERFVNIMNIKTYMNLGKEVIYLNPRKEGNRIEESYEVGCRTCHMRIGYPKKPFCSLACSLQDLHGVLPSTASSSSNPPLQSQHHNDHTNKNKTIFSCFSSQ